MNKKQSVKKASQVIGCRLPYDLYARYEIRCIEEQIEMSKILREAVKKFMKESN